MKHLSLLISFFLLSGCLKEDALNQVFKGIEPVEYEDGHTISSPSAENMDEIGLQNLYAQVYTDDNLWSLRSLLVFRNGRLVSEAYLKSDSDIQERHIIWSCTKQVMGVLAGMAIQHGLIESLEDPISHYLDEELIDHPEKKDITIQQLLTMRSGIQYSNEGSQGQTDKLLRQIPENSVEFILNLPMESMPGDLFHYKDSDPQLVSTIIQKHANKATDLWADELLFSKIGLTNYNWVRYQDGITFGGFGMETTPRELAKFAILVAQKGYWEDEPLIESSWIQEMISPQTILEGVYDFGYYWWIDKARGIHFMWGQGGQFAFIAPAKDLVIIMTSIPNTTGKYEIQADEAIEIVDQIVALSF